MVESSVLIFNQLVFNTYPPFHFAPFFLPIPVCNFVTHERCIPDLKVPCRHVMADMIQVREH